MKDLTDIIVDSACCLILVAILLVPVFAQHAANARANPNNAAHRVSAAYHGGADIARP